MGLLSNQCTEHVEGAVTKSQEFIGHSRRKKSVCVCGGGGKGFPFFLKRVSVFFTPCCPLKFS